MKRFTTLSEASDPNRFGGKAVGLSRLQRAGLPVPKAVVLESGTEISEDLISEILEELRNCRFRSFRYAYAVRSSAIGEDGTDFSFAGQFRTLLNVSSGGLRKAVEEVTESLDAPEARFYRERFGLPKTKMSVLVQNFVPATSAGVLVENGGKIRIEAAWGLGEAVVGGAVIPERYEVLRNGEQVSFSPGKLDRIVLPNFLEEGTREGSWTPIQDPVLTKWNLLELAAAVQAARYAQVVPSDRSLEMEWAFVNHILFLLQARPVRA